MIKDFVGLMGTGLINAMFKQFTFLCLITLCALALRLLLIAHFRPAILRVPELSHAMITYLCFHSIGAFVSLPYNTFVVFVYIFGIQHSPTTIAAIYWMGHWQNSYTLTSPLAVLFLTLERCFIIKLATNQAMRARLERWLCWVGIGTLLAAFLASTCLYLDELPLDITSLQSNGCESVSCLMLKWGNMPQLLFKCSISVLNIVCCVYFLCILHTVSCAMMKMTNYLIIVTICFELCLNCMPALVSISFEYLGMGLLSNVTATCAVLDALCCVIYYSLVFVPPGWLKRVNAVAISTNTTGGPKPLQQHQQHNHHSQQVQRVPPSSSSSFNVNSNLQPMQRNFAKPKVAPTGSVTASTTLSALHN